MSTKINTKTNSNSTKTIKETKCLSKKTNQDNEWTLNINRF